MSALIGSVVITEIARTVCSELNTLTTSQQFHSRKGAYTRWVHMCVRKVGVWGAVSPSKCLRQRECAVSSPMGGYAAAGGGVWKAVQKPSSRQGPL